jgi:hypothetical protein
MLTWDVCVWLTECEETSRVYSGAEEESVKGVGVGSAQKNKVVVVKNPKRVSERKKRERKKIAKPGQSGIPSDPAHTQPISVMWSSSPNRRKERDPSLARSGVDHACPIELLTRRRVPRHEG